MCSDGIVCRWSRLSLDSCTHHLNSNNTLFKTLSASSITFGGSEWRLSSRGHDETHEWYGWYGWRWSMTTRSGAVYQTSQMSTSASADGEGDGEGAGVGTPATITTADVGELVRFLIADRRTRDEELGNRERARHEEQLSIMREMLAKSTTTGSHVRPESTTP